MRLNKKEQLILQKMQENVGKVFTADEIASIYYGVKPRPKNWRNGILCFMRSLALKLENQHLRAGAGPLLIRNSSLGRGNEAAYKVL